MQHWRLALTQAAQPRSEQAQDFLACGRALLQRLQPDLVLTCGEPWLGPLLAACVPLFGSHKILSCKPAGKPKTGGGTGWHAEIQMPLLEGLHPKTLGVALKAAFLFEVWTREQPNLSPVDAAGREAFFAWAEQHALAPLRKLVPGGKSSLHVLRAAFDLGLPFTHLGGGVYQLGWGSKARRINRSSTHLDSVMGPMLTHRKDLTAQLLRAAGLPGAVHALVSTPEAARTAAGRIGWPVVVKPADAERGEGVAVDVQTGGLDAAFADALKHAPSKQVLIKRQIAGTCHRVFVAGGRLLYAVKRLPMGVYGDGESTVAQLVGKACALERLVLPWRRSPVQPLDELALASLAQQGLHGGSVPVVGQFVALRRIETTAWGGVDEDVTATIHSENLRVALAAGAVSGLDVAGVDLISTDITVLWHANGAVINEVNYAPLLGEGVISRQHVQTFVSRLMGGDGRIQVEVYAGSASAVAAARQRALTLRQTGAATALTSHDWTEVPNGQPGPLAVEGLYARIHALVFSPSVGALVIVVQTDELLDRDLPLECVDAVHVVDGAALCCCGKNPQQPRRALLHALRGWVRLQQG